LLSNAINYNASAAPQIHIRAHVASGFLSIDVIDNGGGVSVEEANTVFEKFKRGSRAHNEQGAGLGLAISRALMRLMGGDLTVEFVSQGVSFFRLRLVLVTQSLS
ncbi:MAG: signal transduction histidine kinase, partial [Gammaproteobacteria bacterium]